MFKIKYNFPFCIHKNCCNFLENDRIDLRIKLFKSKFKDTDEVMSHLTYLKKVEFCPPRAKMLTFTSKTRKTTLHIKDSSYLNFYCQNEVCLKLSWIAISCCYKNLFYKQTYNFGLFIHKTYRNFVRNYCIDYWWFHLIQNYKIHNEQYPISPA